MQAPWETATHQPRTILTAASDVYWLRSPDLSLPCVSSAPGCGLSRFLAAVVPEPSIWNAGLGGAVALGVRYGFSDAIRWSEVVPTSWPLSGPYSLFDHLLFLVCLVEDNCLLLILFPKLLSISSGRSIVWSYSLGIKANHLTRGHFIRQYFRRCHTIVYHPIVEVKACVICRLSCHTAWASLASTLIKSLDYSVCAQCDSVTSHLRLLLHYLSRASKNSSVS